MFFKKPLRNFLFPAANLLLSFFLLRAFFIAGQNVVQTFPIAHMSALNYLKPHLMDYFWELNIHNAPMNKSRVRYYADYYEHLLQVFPCLWDTYGILGYCYHFLGDDAKAIDYLKKAILYDPLYTWNYYNLAAIYISQTRYQDALHLIQRLQQLDPQKSLQRAFESQFVYAPLLDAGGKDSVYEAAKHLKSSYILSLDLVQLLNQIPYNRQAEGIIKKTDLNLYAF